MLPTLDCMACVHTQALSAARHATKNPRAVERILRAVARVYSRKKLEATPAEYSQDVYTTVSRVSGVGDPYLKEKRHFNRLALAMLPNCYAALMKSKDPLSVGAHLAVAGNIIDLGIAARLDIHGTLANALHMPFAVSDIGMLGRDLVRCRRLLYVGDNAGEIVFDRVFIEIIQKLHPRLDVCFTVKSGPIINDATMADARAVGMTKLCRVVETGGNWVGAPLARVGRGFMDELDRADIIISKGQGNFETLSGEWRRNIYFILKAKCRVVAEALGVKFGDSVLKHVKGLRTHSKSSSHQVIKS